MLRQLKRRFILAVARGLDRHQAEIEQLQLPRFANAPRNLSISAPRRITNGRYIHMGDDVDFGPNCFLNAIESYPPRRWAEAYGIEPEHFKPRIVIGDRVSATSNVTIAACSEIVIEDDVLMASNINITDTFHGYANIDVPFKYQRMEKPAPIRIGKGSWIGQNCVITPGVTIGAFCVIGSNSVVTASIPDRSIAVGTPARVMRCWSQEAGAWVDARDH